MRRITAGVCLVAGVVSSGVPHALSEDAVQAESALIAQATLPDAIDLKGPRPKPDSSVLAPAVDALPPSLESLIASPPLALPEEQEEERQSTTQGMAARHPRLEPKQRSLAWGEDPSDRSHPEVWPEQSRPTQLELRLR